jgi:sigma-B regulation protein RsbU (phosphoserine phosphatase)
LKIRKTSYKISLLQIALLIIVITVFLLVNVLLVNNLFIEQGNSFLIFRKYTGYILMLSIFILITSSYFIVRTNKKYVEPYSQIVDGLKDSKFVQLGYKSAYDEPMLIKRSIELLHNQLDFYSKKIEQSSSESRKIEDDLKIAKRLQFNILPGEIDEIIKSEKISISAYSESAYEIGGDLYDYFMIGRNRLLFAVGDVSGKGIPAALFMIYTITLLRSIAWPGMTVSQIIEKLNNKLSEENIGDLFVTMLVGIIDLNTGKLSYCNAAHNYPVIIRQEGLIDETSESHGIPLGIYPNRQYASSEIRLFPNDQLFIYTDGVVDTKDENGMNYSLDVLKYNLMGSWFMKTDEVKEKIKTSIKSFRGSVAPVDDITMLVLKYTHRDFEN